MVACKRCGGNCDNGELIGGICLECIEEERAQKQRSDAVRRMLNSPSRQMELKLEVTA